MSNDRTGPGRDRFDDLKEAYVLGALDEDERREFEDYLAAHPELQAEVEELASVADLLALAPQEHEPSPELRRTLLESIGGAPGPTIAGAAPRGTRPRRLFGPGGLAAAAVAAVAALVIVGLALWNVSLRGENEDLRGSLESPKTYQIQGSGPAEDVRGEVIELGDDRGVLVAENMPPVPEGKTYETWLLRGGVPKPAGLFQPRDEGDAATPIEGPLEGAEAVAVTVEPSGGSPAPTEEPILTATL